MPRVADPAWAIVQRRAQHAKAELLVQDVIAIDAYGAVPADRLTNPLPSIPKRRDLDTWA
jgi:hypothetical protein